MGNDPNKLTPNSEFVSLSRAECLAYVVKIKLNTPSVPRLPSQCNGERRSPHKTIEAEKTNLLFSWLVKEQRNPSGVFRLRPRLGETAVTTISEEQEAWSWRDQVVPKWFSSNTGDRAGAWTLVEKKTGQSLYSAPCHHQFTNLTSSGPSLGAWAICARLCVFKQMSTWQCVMDNVNAEGFDEMCN